MRRTKIALGLGLSAALLTTGCQFGGGGGEAKSPENTGKAAAAPKAAPRASSGTPAVSKQVTFPVPGQPGQTYTIGFAGLRVTGQLARLTLVWTPHGIGEDTVSPYDLVGQSTAGSEMTLIDTANLKRYVIVKDSTDHELQSDYVSSETGNNQPLAMTYTFAAPPPNGSMDVVLNDRPLFTAVPVTR